MTREERIEAALATAGKTTPEPWETFDRGDYSDCCGDSRVIIGNDMRVAIVEDDGSAETMANTDLISAASLLRDEVIALSAQVERQGGRCAPLASCARLAMNGTRSLTRRTDKALCERATQRSAQREKL